MSTSDSLYFPLERVSEPRYGHLTTQPEPDRKGIAQRIGKEFPQDDPLGWGKRLADGFSGD